MRNESEPQARIAAVATASPERVLDQREADAVLTNHYGHKLKPRSRDIMHKVLAHPSIRTRHFAFEEPEEIIEEDPDRRIERFTRWAVRLSAEAARKALTCAGVAADSLGAVIVNTCTGYICPGISTYLFEELGLGADTRFYDLVGAGCGGAIPNIQLAAALAAESGRPVLSISAEICTATFEMGDDLSLIISNALFADGAGAAVLTYGGAGPAVIDDESLCAPGHREEIRYVYRGGSLHNQLSVRLPGILRDFSARVVDSLLSRNGLCAADVPHWAIHPGGDKVVNAIGEGLGLAERQLAVTRGVLADFGNCSSATVWYAMERIMESGIAPGEFCVMLAAVAGLSIHAALLRA